MHTLWRRYFRERLILSHEISLRFLIFLVATVAASDQRRIDDGEWAEVDIGAAIGTLGTLPF